MEYLGDYNKWQVHKNSEGFLELFKSIGINKELTSTRSIVANQGDRIVTNVKSIAELASFFRKKKKEKKYNPYADPNQLKIE